MGIGDIAGAVADQLNSGAGNRVINAVSRENRANQMRADFAESVNEFNKRLEGNPELMKLAQERRKFQPDAESSPEDFMSFTSNVERTNMANQTVDAYMQKGLLSPEVAATLKKEAVHNPSKVLSNMTSLGQAFEAKGQKDKLVAQAAKSADIISRVAEQAHLAKDPTLLQSIQDPTDREAARKMMNQFDADARSREGHAMTQARFAKANPTSAGGLPPEQTKRLVEAESELDMLEVLQSFPPEDIQAGLSAYRQILADKDKSIAKTRGKAIESGAVDLVEPDFLAFMDGDEITKASKAEWLALPETKIRLDSVDITGTEFFHAFDQREKLQKESGERMANVETRGEIGLPAIVRRLGLKATQTSLLGKENQILKGGDRSRAAVLTDDFDGKNVYGGIPGIGEQGLTFADGGAVPYTRTTMKGADNKPITLGFPTDVAGQVSTFEDSIDGGTGIWLMRDDGETITRDRELTRQELVDGAIVMAKRDKVTSKSVAIQFNKLAKTLANVEGALKADGSFDLTTRAGLMAHNAKIRSDMMTSRKREGSMFATGIGSATVDLKSSRKKGALEGDKLQGIGEALADLYIFQGWHNGLLLNARSE